MLALTKTLWHRSAKPVFTRNHCPKKWHTIGKVSGFLINDWINDDLLFSVYKIGGNPFKLDGGAVDPVSGLEGNANVFLIEIHKKKLVYSVILGSVDIERNINSYYRMQLLESNDQSLWVWIFFSSDLRSSTFHSVYIVFSSDTGCLSLGVELVQWLETNSSKCIGHWPMRLEDSTQFMKIKLATDSVCWIFKNNPINSIVLTSKLVCHEKYHTHLLQQNWMHRYMISCKCFLT